MQLINFDNAFRHFIKCEILKGRQTWTPAIEVNKQRYRMLDIQGQRCLVMFKKEKFKSFGRIYASKGESGIGESINREDLIKGLKAGVHNFIFIYPDNTAYYMTLADYGDLSFNNKVYLRKTDNEDKEEYSFNFKHLKRWR